MKNFRNTILRSVRRAKLDYLAKIKTFTLPVNFNRILDDVKDKKSDKKDLTPKYIIEALEDVLTNDKTPLDVYQRRTRKY